MNDEHTSRQHPGFISHADDLTPQAWVEQGAAALLSTDDGRSTAAALPTDTAGDNPTLTDIHAWTSRTKSLPHMTAAAQDHRAVANHAATALVHSPEEEPSASSNWPQSEGSGSGSSIHDTSLEPSCASYFCKSSAGVSARDMPLGYITAPITAATAVEPAPGDVVTPTPTGHTLVGSDKAQLVCTVSPHSVTALEVAALGELAVGGLVCPITAVAAQKSKAQPAEAATQTNGQVRMQYSEDAGVQNPAEPLTASRANVQADIDSLAARADATGDAACSFPDSSLAPDADCTLHQDNSAVAALAHCAPAVAVDEPARLVPLQEDQLGVLSNNAQSIAAHTQTSAPETATACVVEEAITEPGLLNSPSGAVDHPDRGSFAALAAEVQPMPQQDSQDNIQQPDSSQDLCVCLQASAYTDFNVSTHVAPDFGPGADPQASPYADPYDESIPAAYAASDDPLAADAGAVPAMPSQAHAAAPHSDQSPDTAEVLQNDHICDTHLVTALTAKAESDTMAMLPDCSPQEGVLEGNENLADLAAELAAMMTLADSSSALTTQSLDELTQSSIVEHCQDGTAAVSCTEDPGPIVIKATEAPVTFTATESSTELSVPAGNVSPNAAIMPSAALPEQEQGVAIPKERGKTSSYPERLLAAAAATKEKARAALHVESPLDGATWHAQPPLMQPSWHHTTQLQSMLADAGTASLIECTESWCTGLLTSPCCIFQSR